LTGALHDLSLQLSPLTSILLSYNKIQNGDILVLANPGPPEKWPLKWKREREREREYNWRRYRRQTMTI